MFAFWLIAGLLVAVALLFVLPPLLGRRRDPAPSRDDVIRALHGQRLAELERDVKADVLTAAQYERARLDLERELLAESAGHAEPAERSSRASPAWAAWVVGLVLPALAIGLYIQFSTGLRALDDAPARIADAQEPPSVEDMARLIEARLEQNPDDRTGWIMLARVNSLMGQYANAARAYARADGLAELDEPGLLVGYAQSLALADGEQFAGKPTELLNKALELGPNNQVALWLAGRAAFQREDFVQAAQLWERLKKLIPATDGGTFEQLPQQIAEAKRLARQPSAIVGARNAAAGGMKAADDRGAPRASIRVAVELTPALEDLVSPGHTLFIYAQALDDMRVPLAIARNTVAELPLELTLDDSMAMAPAFKLSGEDKVKVTARISKSGDATPRAGDLVGESKPVPTRGGAQVSVTIDKVLP